MKGQRSTVERRRPHKGGSSLPVPELLRPGITPLLLPASMRSHLLSQNMTRKANRVYHTAPAIVNLLFCFFKPFLENAPVQCPAQKYV